MNTPQQQPESIATLIYRIETMERDVAQLKSQLTLYEPTRENDLKLQRINDTVGRIETELGKVKERLESMNTKLTQQEQAARERDSQQREEQAKLVIGTLKWAVGLVVSGLLLLLGAYFTHLIH